MPRIPKYIRSSEKEILYTNQDCIIKTVDFKVSKDEIAIKYWETRFH